MRVLIVTRHYAPSIYPHAFRWSAIAEHWAKGGHEVTVICGDEPGSPAREDRNSVSVLRVGNAWSGLVRKRYGRRACIAPSDSASRSGFDKLAALTLQWIHDRTWRRLYWPDSYCPWYPAAVVAAFQQARCRWDVVITASFPFTAHLVGLAFKKWQPDVTWLVDIADPFSLDGQFPQNNTGIYARLNRAAEAAVMRAASRVIVTCEDAAYEYRRIWPQHASKVSLIPHLAIALRPNSTSPNIRNYPLRLTFIGTLDGLVRDPGALFSIVSELRESGYPVELHLYGKVQNCNRRLQQYCALVGLGIFLYGPVEREEAWRQMCCADVLVNIGNNVPFQLPSKLVDYVAAAKPILNVVGKSGDPSELALRGYDPVLSVFCPSGTVDRSVVAEVARFLGSKSTAPEDQRLRWLAQFELPAIVRAYEEQIAFSKSPEHCRPMWPHVGPSV